MFRPQPISSTDARKYFTKIINKVSFSSKSFVIQSYRQPLVRVVNENYIKVLEEVLGKKTVNQVIEIASNDRLFETEKMEQIKKVFQRRLSGPPQSKSQPKPQPKPPAPAPKQKPAPPNTPNPEPNPSPKTKNPNPRTSNPKPPTSNRGRVVLLLPNGKNYQ